MTNNNKVTVGVVGVGAIGGHVGGWLIKSIQQNNINNNNTQQQQQQLHIKLLCRQSLYDNIQHNQCIYVSRVNQQKTRIDLINNNNVTITTEPSDLSDCNIILVCVKTLDTSQAIQTILPYIQGNTIIVSLQNGIANKQIIKDILHNNNKNNIVLSGIVEYNVSWKNNNEYILRTSGRVIIENNNNQYIDLLVNKLNSVGLITIKSDNILSEQYSKLLLNLANSINALSGLPVKQMFSIRLYRHCYASAIEEAVYILNKHNIKPAKILGKLPFRLFIWAFRLPDYMFSKLQPLFVKTDDSAELSMSQDLLRNKHTEIDYINGHFVMLAQQLNIQSPINSALCKLVHEAEQQQQRPAIPSKQLADIIHCPSLYENNRISMILIGIIISLVAVTAQLTKKNNNNITTV